MGKNTLGSKNNFSKCSWVGEKYNPNKHQKHESLLHMHLETQKPLTNHGEKN